MKHFSLLARSVGMSALLAVAATPAFAEGKADRARQAIAQAQGKIEAVAHLGATVDAPHLTAQASAALRAAREDLASGHKERAIADANHASELADTAMGQAQANRAAEERDHRAQAESTAAAAQQDAAAANARADSAQQAAASAAADAAAARATPPVVIAAQPTTTVTTETVKETTAARTSTARPRVVHRVTRRASHPAPVVAERTTTTVTTAPN